MGGCTTTTFKAPVAASCPPYPIAGPSVAYELGRLDPKDFPATEEWLGRLDKLRDQLEICR